MSTLSKLEIENLLKLLEEKLKAKAAVGEVYLVGGAVMCLVFNARPATKDIDAYFKPSQLVRELSKEIAEERDLDPSWLNDAVKGYLSDKGRYNTYLELPSLKIFVASPEYLLAMKCLALRIGAEFSDENDIRYLLRYLNIEKYEDAIHIITQYYPLEKFPQKTLYGLEEILK
ncbi:MAG: hypothetical protein KBC84_01670 [Proteobacteria bacterium]|nr:hypothetical protein [Pseudomonadota bacterium]